MARLQTKPKRKRARGVSPSPEDRPLANLPEDVLENVFSFLPLAEAIQASTVSKKFKKSWRLNRNFRFGRDFALRYRREDYTALVDRHFNSHEGDQIQVFELQIDPIGVEELIQKWLRICIQKGVQELELFFFQPGFTLRADSVDNLKSLRTLKLVYCDFQLPPVLTSMRFLNTLVLWQIQLTEDKLETLLSRCKLLETLDLFQCSVIRFAKMDLRDHKRFKALKIACCNDLEEIVIDSPTLSSMFYCGYVISIRFVNKVELEEAIFNFEPTSYRSYLPSTLVDRVVLDIRHVKVLSASALIPEAMAARVRNGHFQDANYCFENLTEFQLFMDGGLFCNPYDVLMFLQHCPKLEKLIIDMNDYNFDCGTYWELHQKPNIDNFCNFNRLKDVKLKGFKFLPSELEFVKVLLLKAISLETLIFVTPKNGRTKLNSEDKFKCKHLLLSWKASPAAKVVLYENSQDQGEVSPSHPKCWY